MARILVAEDDDFMRQFLARALTRAGHDVVSVGNGADALAVTVRGRFNLLLADVVMPEVDGLELARRAVVIDPDLRVMFITGFAAVALHRRRPKDPPAKVLSKPFHLRTLVAEVERALSDTPVDKPARS